MTKAAALIGYTIAAAVFATLFSFASVNLEQFLPMQLPVLLGWLFTFPFIPLLRPGHAGLATQYFLALWFGWFLLSAGGLTLVAVFVSRGPRGGSPKPGHP